MKIRPSKDFRIVRPDDRAVYRSFLWETESNVLVTTRQGVMGVPKREFRKDPILPILSTASGKVRVEDLQDGIYIEVVENNTIIARDALVEEVKLGMFVMRTVLHFDTLELSPECRM